MSATTTKKDAKAKEPMMTPRSKLWAALDPPFLCEKIAITHAKTGNGERSPLHFGPRRLPAPVMSRTIVVAVAIRTGRSHRGAGTAGATKAGAPSDMRATLRSGRTSNVETRRLNDPSDTAQVTSK
jgi:hypothetical protein